MGHILGGIYPDHCLWQNAADYLALAGPSSLRSGPTPLGSQAYPIGITNDSLTEEELSYPPEVVQVLILVQWQRFQALHFQPYLRRLPTNHGPLVNMHRPGTESCVLPHAFSGRVYITWSSCGQGGTGRIAPPCHRLPPSTHPPAWGPSSYWYISWLLWSHIPLHNATPPTFYTIILPLSTLGWVAPDGLRMG